MKAVKERDLGQNLSLSVLAKISVSPRLEKFLGTYILATNCIYNVIAPLHPWAVYININVSHNYFSGAERALDELLVKKSQVGKWVYKQKHDHQLVSAVCIQIKGDIQYNLGQWLQGAKLLIESLILFRYV